MTQDVIVIGLGAHGSAAAYHLAKRGLKVLGLEQFPRGHTLGSSGGLSRIIRLSYYEHPDYVPMLRRAWDLWRELEREAGETLLTQTGGLYLGRPDGELVSRALLSATTHGLAHEELDAAALRARYPLFRIDDDWIGLHETQAGWLAPERCIETHLRMAERHGAQLEFGARARWSTDGDGVRVTTAAGTYSADALVVTAGVWMPEMLPELAAHLWIERNVLFWFEPVRRTSEFDALPVWILEDDDRFYYGFPRDPQYGFKVAGLRFGDRVDPNSVDREASPGDEARLRSFLARRIPDADGERRFAKVCMYTNSPDRQFVIDRAAANVVFASACSGHGFKFASAIGELLADMHQRRREPPRFLTAGRLAAV